VATTPLQLTESGKAAVRSGSEQYAPAAAEPDVGAKPDAA
jgi:hypothetical protein